MSELYFGIKNNEHSFLLQEEEFHHCIRVTRHKPGSKILITAFDGVIYSGIIESIEDHSALVKIEKIHQQEKTDQSRIYVAISLTQQTDRFEWFLEKSVENGIHAIIPTLCQRTLSKKFRPERLNKLIRSAAKQSHRAMIPSLYDAIPLYNLFDQIPDISQRFIGYCDNDEKQFLGKLYNPVRDVVLLIGPAGDFTPEEISWAKSNECKAVSLGDFRLRTETAGLTALQILQTMRQL